jgi:subtilisin-like proprotein convertase family protein
MLFATQAHAALLTATTNSVAITLPNPGGFISPTNVKAQGKVRDVNVSVRIGHDNDPDLILALRSPSGRYVTLANGRGGNVPATNNDYGNGATSCAGTQTSFDDEAATPFALAPAPWPGSFKPEQPLSSLDGTEIKGRWEFYVLDTQAIGVGANPGTLYCMTMVVDFKPTKKKKKKK